MHSQAQTSITSITTVHIYIYIVSDVDGIRFITHSKLSMCVFGGGGTGGLPLGKLSSTCRDVTLPCTTCTYLHPQAPQTPCMAMAWHVDWDWRQGIATRAPCKYKPALSLWEGLACKTNERTCRW